MLLERGKPSVRFWRILIFAFAYLVLVSCAGQNQNTGTSTLGTFTPTPLPLPTSVPTSAPTPTATPSATPVPTLGALPLPSLPPNAELLTFSADSNRTAWIGSQDRQPHWGDPNLESGVYGGQTLVSFMQFNLQSLAPGSKILFAALDVAGRDAGNLGTTGKWTFDMIDSSAVASDAITFDAVNQTSSLATVAQVTAPQVTAAGVTQRFIFTSAQLPLIEKQLNIGKLTFRIRGPSSGADSLFAWVVGSTEPTLYLVTVPASFVVITTTPTPPDVFAAATLVAMQTTQARDVGTPTPLPRTFATATPGATLDNVVVTSIPTPVSTADRTATAVYATAVAATTGTFTPTPFNWIVATPRPLLIPRDLLTPVPSPTATPVGVDLLALAKMPLPSVLYNKIMFREGSRLNPNIWVMNPDGSDVELLTDHQYYDIAKMRDTVSPDGTKWVYQWPDGTGKLQLWIRFLQYPDALPQQITFGGGGLVFGQAWSPDGNHIAYTSDTVARQEIWVYTLFPPTWQRLTYSTGWYWNQFPSWSPDGTQIVFSTDRGHDAKFSEIWIMNADGSSPRDLGNGVWDAYDPVWVKWHQ